MSSSSVSSAAASSGVTAITNQTEYNSAYTQFLSLLTTELQNQDPTSPMDATQFTNQLVGFSQLEQELQTNSFLSTMVSSQQSTQLAGSIGYLGQTVIASGDNFSYSGSGTVPINYSLPSAGSATITITDSSGTKIGTYAADGAAGLNTMTIPGGSTNIPALAKGDYTYTITATDATGKAITPIPYTTGLVTGVDTSTGTPILHLGDILVNASSVIEVMTPPSSTS